MPRAATVIRYKKDCRGRRMFVGDEIAYMMAEAATGGNIVKTSVIYRFTDKLVQCEDGKFVSPTKCVLVSRQEDNRVEEVRRLAIENQALYNAWKKTVDLKCIAVTKLSMEIRRLRKANIALYKTLVATQERVMELEGGDGDDI